MPRNIVGWAGAPQLMEGNSKYFWIFLIMPACILVVWNLAMAIARLLNR